jgi:transcriptional regulator with XRE-family HTH domain
MSRPTSLALPVVARILREVGEHVRLARRRRRLTAAQVAERAGMSRPTLRAVERGEASVTLGSLANVLHVLGLEKDLTLIARDDVLGRKLQDAILAGSRRRSGDRDDA